MKMHIIKAFGAAGSAGALILLCLTGVGGAASASPSPVQPAHAVPVSSLAPPGSFQPVAASFVSPAWGVVLGGSGCTAKTATQVCRAQLAVTADGGARWSLMRAPAVWLFNASSSLPQVSQVVFADRADGWLYDQYLSGRIWVTHNGGASWREITLPGDITAMAVSAHAVYSVAGNQLYSSPIGRNAWTQVNARTRYGPMTGTTLAVSGNSVWFGSGTYLWMADGVHWARHPFRCPAPATRGGEPFSLAGISAANGSDVAFLCAAEGGMFHSVMKVLVSFNGGRSERQAPAAAPSGGDVAAFAVAPGHFGAIAIAVLTPGQDRIYRSADLGRTWTTFEVPGTGGGTPLTSLEFMSPTVACFVAGNPSILGELMWTTNAGRTWYPVRF
jgi:hypothetical protein